MLIFMLIFMLAISKLLIRQDKLEEIWCPLSVTSTLRTAAFALAWFSSDSRQIRRDLGAKSCGFGCPVLYAARFRATGQIGEIWGEFGEIYDFMKEYCTIPV